jgi:pSer/pThr/pTyr-binding forkhead associated (FHA) protein
VSELTLTILRLGLLVLLWLFVFSVVGVLRGDIYGTRVVTRRPARGSRRSAPRRAAHSQGQQAPQAQPQPAPPRPSRAEPTALAVTEGPLTGTTLPLRDTGTLIGRNPECALVLADDFASGRHARIFRDASGWKVEDLGSTNGTFLGSTRLTGPAPVVAGSVLRIGKTVIELRK